MKRNTTKASQPTSTAPRVLAGLTPEETTEFELLDVQLPLDRKLAWRSSDLPLSPEEQRWAELFRKMEAARKRTAA